MDIPPELFDEILSCLPSDDRRSLQSCSLVAKSWVNPSRRRLFETVHIRATTLRAWQTSIPPADDREPQRAALALQPWLDSIPPANGGLFEYVQWLLQLRSVIASRRDHVPNQPLQGIRSCLQQLRDIIPPAENGLLYYVRSLLQSIRDTIPPEDVELLHHVRSLSYSADTRDRGGVRPEYFSSVLRNYYPSLHQLQHLSLSSVCFVSNTPQDIGMFSAFRHTLSRLSLNSCDFTISTLVSLIDYFPNLNRLDLTRPLSCVNDKPVRPVSRPLLRQLHISEAYEGGFSILDQLSEVGLAFDEIVVDGPSPVSLHTLGRVVDAVGARVRCLKLSNPLETCTYITLQRSPLQGSLNLEPASYRPCEGQTHNSLSLPRAPGIRDPCRESGGRGCRPPFFHHVDEHSKGDIRAHTLISKILGLGKS